MTFATIALHVGQAALRPLVDAAHQRVPIVLVLADADFDSERNHQ